MLICPDGATAGTTWVPACTSAYTVEDYLPAPYWTLDFPGAVDLLGAAAIVWALAWGIRMLVRNVFNLR
jgi:hypothetical protein